MTSDIRVLIGSGNREGITSYEGDMRQNTGRMSLLSCGVLKKNMPRAGQLLAIHLLIVFTASVFLAGCGPRRTPNLGQIFAEARKLTGKRPLVIIPGVLGSQLVNSKTKEVIWPAAFRSKGGGLALPVTPNLAENRDDLEPRSIIDTLKFSRLIPEIFIYHQLLEALRDFGGYSEGDWNNPGETGDRDKFYVFAYDWRRDNVENAALLIRRLSELKSRLGRPDLRFNIVAHSMGGLIARYAAEYGETDLPGDGVAPVPTWAGAVHINKILMFGTPNEGAADAFVTLLDGYSITDGRHARLRLLTNLGPEDNFTAPSLFQLMPHRGSERFLDGDLKPIEVDLYDPNTWRKYGWGAPNNPDYRRRFVSGRQVGQAGPTLEDLDGYMAAVIHRAQRFHEALDAPLGGGKSVVLLAFGGDCEDTLNSPVIIRNEKANRWVTMTEAKQIRSSTGRLISKKEMIAAMYAPGDGRVTRRSLLAENLVLHQSGSPFVKAGLPFAYAVFACDRHGELQNNKNLQDNALTALVAEAVD